MNPAIKKLIGQAVIQYLNGDTKKFRDRSYAAYREYQREAERNRLYATIEEMLEHKKVR